MRITLLSAPAALLLLSSIAWADGPAAAPARTVVLDTDGFYRVQMTWIDEQERLADGSLVYVTAGTVNSRLVAKQIDKPFRTEPPAANWRSVDFDDSDWARVRGPLFTRKTRKIALLCLRGRFDVPDPGHAADLKLTLLFRGGVAVYLNGKEIARAHLPAGELTPDTPAEDYPTDAYVDPNGGLLRWVGFGDPEKYPDRFKLRVRTLEADMPAEALRKGVNVLAVEIHRSPVAETLFTARVLPNGASYSYWSQLGLEKLELSAAGGTTPNASRPPGVQLWNQAVQTSVHTPDYGDPGQAVYPIRLYGTRNGAFSGQVVLSSDGPIRGVKATCDGLTGLGGAKIAASAVQVRFATPGFVAEGGQETKFPYKDGPGPRFGRDVVRLAGLEESAPPEVAPDKAGGGAIVPVWVTVNVPADAAAGDYAGQLVVSADGFGPAAVPVKLAVAGWTLPAPAEYRTFVGLIQSPDSLAMQYHVEPWSEAHWKLIDRSFELLAQAGDKVIYLPLLRGTYFGNEQSMVRWIPRSDGTYDHDFSIMQRYLETAIRRLGKVPVVCAYCWDVNTGSSYMGGGHDVPKLGMPVTFKDAATGALSKGNGPTWGDPAVRTFWKPVLDELARQCERLGVGDSLMLGIAGDRRPGKDCVEDLAAVAPKVPWVVSSHSSPSDLYGVQKVGYNTIVWGVGNAPDPAAKRVRGWARPRLIACFPRYIAPPVGEFMRCFSPWGVYRIAAEGMITSNSELRGFGRVGADFWPLLKSKRSWEPDAPLCGRYPDTNAWHGGWLHNSTPYVLMPGRERPISSAAFEMIREGVQLAEARIFIERALTDATSAAALGPDMARRAQELLDRRVRLNLLATDGMGGDLGWAWYAAPQMEVRNGDLFALAAEVAARLKQ
ncbi:MAG: hypothetical protein BIFFINMI_00020 [Phycisphaerae bacterium]|nr:hypothetical protein [Phycisphaerae bacterium]